jgi:hypothetical protein
MIVVYPGDLRVVRLTKRAEVFVPASEEQIAAFERAYLRELPHRITPMIDVLNEAFPRVAEAYRLAGITTAIACIGLAIDEYEDEPDEVLNEIIALTGAFDLRLTFRTRAELEEFLRAYEALLTTSERA